MSFINVSAKKDREPMMGALRSGKCRAPRAWRQISGVMLCLLAGVSSADGGENLSWPQFGGVERNFLSPLPAQMGRGEAMVWKRKLGQGTSGIVSDGKRLYTMYSVPDAQNRNRGEEVVIALDPTTGETRWEHRYPLEQRKGQETFTNDPVRPQATPALVGGRLVTLGYAGLLKCFEAATGRVLWERDLVKEWDATPVQFGFSASPLIYRGDVIVHVGGKRAAVVAFDIASGTARWQSEPAEPGYASPVVMRFGAEEHIVQVTRDAVLGVSAQDGKTRWRYPMPKPGQTNVPTPLALAQGRLLVSGQGILGTRLLKVERKDSAFTVSEVWKNTRVTFFYCNWIVEAGAVYGCMSGFLTGLSLADGRELWRERGQEDANQIRIGEETILLRGDGQLSRGKQTAKGLGTSASLQALQGRCWAAPTPVRDMLYVRDDREIAAVRLSGLFK